MERYKRTAQLLCWVNYEKELRLAGETEAYRDIAMAIEGSTPNDLWAYIDVEKKKAEKVKNSDVDYAEWIKARGRIDALESAEHWLKRIGDGE